MPYNLFCSVMMFVWKIVSHRERKSRKTRTKQKLFFFVDPSETAKMFVPRSFLVFFCRFSLESKKS